MGPLVTLRGILKINHSHHYIYNIHPTLFALTLRHKYCERNASQATVSAFHPIQFIF